MVAKRSGPPSIRLRVPGMETNGHTTLRAGALILASFGATVRLGVDGNEFDRRKRLREQGHPTGDTPCTGRLAAILARLPARLAVAEG